MDFTSFGPINVRNYGSDGFFSEMIKKRVVQTCLRINKMVNSSNGPAAKLLAWLANRILLSITKN